MKLSKFRSDTTLASEGAKVNFVTGEVLNDETFERDKSEGYLIVQVRRWSYQPFQNALVEQLRRSRAVRENDDVDVLSQIVRTLVAKKIVVRWWNLEHDDGSAWEYCLKDCIEILTDDAYMDFYEAVVQYSKNRETFLAKVDEADQGNSLSGPNGSVDSGPTSDTSEESNVEESQAP